jgi:predicted outer membrane repeat protein
MSMTHGQRVGVLMANLAALATASAVHGQSRIIYVDDDAPAGGNRTSWSGAYRDLQDAFDEAASLSNPQSPIDVEIRIGQGVYRPDAGTLERTKYFELAPSVASGLTLSVLGGFGGRGSAVPDHRDLVNFVSVLSGDLLGNDTASEASRADNSHAILQAIDQASLTIDGLVIRGANSQDTFEIAAYVTAKFKSPYLEEVLISRCTIEDNLTNRASGAIMLRGYDWGVKMRVEDCIIRGNRNNDVDDPSGPGGMRIMGNTHVARTLFENNSTIAVGGAVFCDGGWVELADCVFVGNSAIQDGSAIYAPVFDDHAPTFTRCTFRDNPSGNSVIGLKQGRLSGCIIHDGGTNTAGQHSIEAELASDPIHIDHCNIEGGIGSISAPSGYIVWGPGNIDADPMYGPGLELLAGSPCIDAGRPTHPRREDRDVRGFARMVDGNYDGVKRVDMGAHEFQVDCAADFDSSGFVDTDDFDAFMRAFEAGC